MKIEKSITWGNGSLVLSFLLLSSVYFSPAFASSNGTQTSGLACSACHSGGDAATLTIIGPELVLPHSENTYTLTISGGPAVIGGLDVWAPDGGTLSIVDALTQITSGEVTHTEPKAFAGGTVSWDFIWTAPETLGFYDLMAQGVSANDGQGNSGDGTGSTFLNIEVAAIPIPAAVYLFGSALGLLGWMRRRAA